MLWTFCVCVETGSLGNRGRSADPGHETWPAKRLPVVLTKPEVRLVLAQLSGTYLLIARLLYGAGLRLLECLRLRVKDLDFAQSEITVRHGKGGKDRRTMLPDLLKPDLTAHLDRVRLLHRKDLARGFGSVLLPDALDRKLPAASTDWRWQFVFPSANLSVDPRSGKSAVITPTKVPSAVK